MNIIRSSFLYNGLTFSDNTSGRVVRSKDECMVQNWLELFVSLTDTIALKSIHECHMPNDAHIPETAASGRPCTAYL